MRLYRCYCRGNESKSGKLGTIVRKAGAVIRMFETLCMVGPRIRKTSSVPGRRKAGAAVDDSTHRLIIVSLTLPHEVLELKQVLRALCAYAQGGMAIQLATILPALICAHVLGAGTALVFVGENFWHYQQNTQTSQIEDIQRSRRRSV